VLEREERKSLVLHSPLVELRIACESTGQTHMVSVRELETTTALQHEVIRQMLGIELNPLYYVQGCKIWFGETLLAPDDSINGHGLQQHALLVVNLPETKAAIEVDQRFARCCELFRAIEAEDLRGILSVCAYAPDRVHERNALQWTPLHKACALGYSTMVEILIFASADPRAQDSVKPTVLACVIKSNRMA